MNGAQIMITLNKILLKNRVGAGCRRGYKDFDYQAACAYIVKEHGWDRDRATCMFFRDARKDMFRLYMNLYDTCQALMMTPAQTKEVLDCVAIHEVDWSLPQKGEDDVEEG